MQTLRFIFLSLHYELPTRFLWSYETAKENSIRMFFSVFPTVLFIDSRALSHSFSQARAVHARVRSISWRVLFYRVIIYFLFIPFAWFASTTSELASRRIVRELWAVHFEERISDKERKTNRKIGPVFFLFWVAQAGEVKTTNISPSDCLFWIFQCIFHFLCLFLFDTNRFLKYLYACYISMKMSKCDIFFAIQKIEENAIWAYNEFAMNLQTVNLAVVNELALTQRNFSHFFDPLIATRIYMPSTFHSITRIISLMLCFCIFSLIQPEMNTTLKFVVHLDWTLITVMQINHNWSINTCTFCGFCHKLK